jgi:sensor domain DACNV-containing protein
MAIKYPEDTAESLLDRLAEYREALSEARDGQGESAEREEFEEPFDRAMPLPSLDQLHELLEVSFFASLMTEEGELVSFTIGYISPELGDDSNWSVLRFGSPRPLTPAALRRLSPALLPDSTCCGVFPNAEGALEIWGLVFLPRSIGLGERLELPGITISSRQPGTILVRQSGQDVMIDMRGSATFLDQARLREQAGLKTFLAKLVGDKPFPESLRAAAELLRLAKVAVQGGHGATFLVIPRGAEPEALSEPQIYADEQSRNLVAEALKNPAFEGLPNLVARLSFMDGAMIVDDALNLVGAGAMIRSPLRSAPHEIEYALISPTKPVDCPEPRSIDEFPGGSRHRSAIEFCYWNPGSVALVVSQDGVMSLMSRPLKEDTVLVLRPFYPNEAGL